MTSTVVVHLHGYARERIDFGAQPMDYTIVYMYRDAPWSVTATTSIIPTVYEPEKERGTSIEIE